MLNQIFLYEKPFVAIDNQSMRQQYLSDTIRITDYEREDEKQLREMLFRFAVEKELVVLKDGMAINNLGHDTGSWIWMVSWMNMRSLTSMTQYGRLMSALQTNDGWPITNIIDLHLRIGTMFDHRLLNSIVHRTITSIDMIPYEVKDEDDFIPWSQIHLETPFVWILVLMQSVMRSEVRQIG